MSRWKIKCVAEKLVIWLASAVFAIRPLSMMTDVFATATAEHKQTT